MPELLPPDAERLSPIRSLIEQVFFLIIVLGKCGGGTLKNVQLGEDKIGHLLSLASAKGIEKLSHFINGGAFFQSLPNLFSRMEFGYYFFPFDLRLVLLKNLTGTQQNVVHTFS
jgi:hypothetical protein